MKGTATLVLHETYNDRKAFILSCVVVARKLVKTLSANIDKYPTLKQQTLEVIELEQQYIKDQLSELTELKRWQIREGIKEDEPYIYPSIRKRNAERERQQQNHSVHLARAKESGNYDYWTPETCMECKADSDNK